MFGVAQAGGVFSQPRHFHTGGRGAQGEALAQRAAEGRIFTQDRVEQGEPGAGAESRVAAGSGTDSRLNRRPRSLRKHLL